MKLASRKENSMNIENYLSLSSWRSFKTGCLWNASSDTGNTCSDKSTILVSITWAQFHRAAKHKICLAWNFFLDRQVYRPNFHVIFRISKQKLRSSNKHYATNGHFGGNPVFMGESFMLSKFVCLAALWNWAQVVLNAMSLLHSLF